VNPDAVQGSRENLASIFIIIPVKRLDEAKSRLSPVLSDDERRQLCLEMLNDVLTAVKKTGCIRRTMVVSTDTAVHKEAKSFGTMLFKEKRYGLNHVIAEVIDWCARERAESVLIIPADIPLITPEDLKQILSAGRNASMVISSSLDMDGTNALFLRPPDIFPPSYGPHSFKRHVDGAMARKLRFHVLKSPKIALDIDTVEGLMEFLTFEARRTHTYRFLVRAGIVDRLIHESNRRSGKGII